MDDVSADKTILKQSPSWAGRHAPAAALTIYPFIEGIRQGQFGIEISGESARIYERYAGEAIPVIQFILSRWPAYDDIFIEDDGRTFREMADQEPPRVEAQQKWYHGTTSVNLPGIERMGLAPRAVNQRNYRGVGGSETGLVYLGSSFEDAKMHAENAAKQFGGAAVVLEIDITGLENSIVDDHDVRLTHLGNAYGTRSIDVGDITTRRLLKTPGASSYRTIGTIAFKGRIPPARITVVWQGKEKIGRAQKKADHLSFVNQLSTLAKQLRPGELTDFFAILGVQISGYNPQPYYAPVYYKDPEKTVNSVYARKSEPKAFLQWVSGMRRRAAKWRRREQQGLSSAAEAAIVRLINQEHARLSASVQ